MISEGEKLILEQMAESKDGAKTQGDGAAIVSQWARGVGVEPQRGRAADGGRSRSGLQLSHFYGVRGGRRKLGLRHADCNRPKRRTGRAQIGMFTQRVRGWWRNGFLLGAARRGVAF
jgi:hypothetical protein